MISNQIDYPLEIHEHCCCGTKYALHILFEYDLKKVNYKKVNNLYEHHFMNTIRTW